MDFIGCYVKAAKADIAKGQISFTFTVELNQRNLDEAQNLAEYIDEDAGAVDVLVTPYQAKMFRASIAKTEVPATETEASPTS